MLSLLMAYAKLQARVSIVVARCTFQAMETAFGFVSVQCQLILCHRGQHERVFLMISRSSLNSPSE